MRRNAFNAYPFTMSLDLVSFNKRNESKGRVKTVTGKHCNRRQTQDYRYWRCRVFGLESIVYNLYWKEGVCCVR